MKRQETLEAAIKCVCGERQDQYGRPEDNFKTIAKLWSAYLGYTVSDIDVAMMMSLLKIARIRTGTATDDSFVDLAGYAACGAEIAHRHKLLKGEAHEDQSNRVDFEKREAADNISQ